MRSVTTVTQDIITKLRGAGKDLGVFSLETVKIFTTTAALPDINCE
jgi:hypothetical protein